MDSKNTTLLDSALAYARGGCRVFPLRGKIPRTAHGAHDATTDAETICGWWSRWPTADIGMTLAGLVVVDIDPRNGGTLRSVPPMPETCVAKTGGGGLHYLFRASPGARYPGKYCAGVDIKSGAGAYIVVAPSLHVSGARYEWLSSPADTEPAQAPDWLAREASYRTAAPAVRRNAVHVPRAPVVPATRSAWVADGWVSNSPTSQSKTYNFA